MSTADTKAQIAQVIAGFQQEVPALGKLKLVFELELRDEPPPRTFHPRPALGRRSGDVTEGAA